MPITMKQTKGKPKLARVLDNKKPPIEKDDISMIKPHELNALTSWNLFTQMKNIERENAIVMVPLNKGKVFFPPAYHVFCKSSQSIAKDNELMECAKKVRKNMYIKEAAQEAWKHYENIFSNELRLLYCILHTFKTNMFIIKWKSSTIARSPNTRV